MIRALSKDAVQPLAAAQVIVDLAAAVKELIENALDANASAITVTFWNYGIDAFQVVDDGKGISLDDLQVVGRRHHTSKLRDDAQLLTVRTFGFRGEAIHAIISLSARVAITSSTEDSHENTLGSGIVFERAPLAEAHGNEGARKISRVPCARGCTVKVGAFLTAFPVRLAEWRRNKARCLAKAIGVVQTYAIGVPSVRFRCIHILHGPAATAREAGLVFATSGSRSIPTAYSEAWRTAAAAGLASMPSALEEPAALHLVKGRCGDLQRSLPLLAFTLYFGLGGALRKTIDRQFVFINRRPCDMPQLLKSLHQVTKGNHLAGFPVIILHVESVCDDNEHGGRIDVNLVPDKRSVILEGGEQYLIDAVSSAYGEALSAQRAIPKVVLSSSSATATSSSRLGRPFQPHLASPIQSPSEGASGLLESECYTDGSCPCPDEATAEGCKRPSLERGRLLSQADDVGGISSIMNLSNFVAAPILSDSCGGGDDATEATEQFLQRSDFLNLSIIGQFNCGFIIASLAAPSRDASLAAPGGEEDSKAGGSRVFIIDQHASDERYRLETLENALRPSQQILIHPIVLADLAFDEKMFILDHIDIFSAALFSITPQPPPNSASCAEEEEGDGHLDHAPPLLLTRAPVVMGIQLNEKDFYEMVMLTMRDEYHSLASLRRVSMALASKACRSAVMIGESLSHAQMKTIVSNLAHMRKPWICAHGRPTVRLLYTSSGRQAGRL